MPVSRVRPLPRLTASVTALTLGFGLLVATPAVSEAADKTTYLGLEGETDQVTALSDAIRWDLTQRGRDDGNTLSLAELKLTMGCGDEDYTCLAQGGQAIGAEEFVFGKMTRTDKGWAVKLYALDVATGKVSKQITREVAMADLNEGTIGKTATSLVDQLYGLAPAPVENVPPPPTEPAPPPEQVADEGGGRKGQDTSDATADEPRDADGELVWGAYSPRPTWKYVGVGVSGALTVAALATAIGTTVAIGPNGPVRDDLLTAAASSLTDDKPSNDVDPNTDQDLCPLAEAPPDPSRPDEVTNAEMTQICIKADRLAATATASWVATGVFAASTVVFTTLLFVHKDKRSVAKLIERDFGLGGAPLHDGGFVLGGSFRF